MAEKFRTQKTNRLVSFLRSSSTFSPSTTDDAERDEVLNQKICIFRWIREEHLDIPHSPHNEAYLNNAQSGKCHNLWLVD